MNGRKKKKSNLEMPKNCQFWGYELNDKKMTN